MDPITMGLTSHLGLFLHYPIQVYNGLYPPMNHREGGLNPLQKNDNTKWDKLVMLQYHLFFTQFGTLVAGVFGAKTVFNRRWRVPPATTAKAILAVQGLRWMLKPLCGLND